MLCECRTAFPFRARFLHVIYMQKYIDAEVITVLAFQGAVKYVSNQLPIGVFDSGVGGLTVASAIKAELPE